MTTPTTLKPATFAPQTTFAVGTNPYSVSVADANSDSNVDLSVIYTGTVSNSSAAGLTPENLRAQALREQTARDLITAEKLAQYEKGLATIEAARKENEVEQASIAAQSAKKYVLSVDKNLVNEGDTVTFKLETTNVAEGTKIPIVVNVFSTFSGSGSFVSLDDLEFGASLSLFRNPGQIFTVDGNGKASFTVKFKEDKLTEGAEKLTLTLGDTIQTTTVSVKDTSLTPITTQHSPTGKIQISGNAIQDETLSIQNTLKDEDGLGTFNYQWLQNSKAISGATQSTYTLSENDIGTAISVKVSYTDGLKKLESATSDATALIESKPEEILPPTYALTVDKTSVNEGDTVTFKLVTENVEADTEIPFSFGGSISNVDVLDEFKTNSFVVGANGKASLAVKFIADKFTDGAENLTLTLNSGESQSVAVKDTSLTPAPPAPVMIVKPIEVMPVIEKPVVVKPVTNPVPAKEITLETRNPNFQGQDKNPDNVVGSSIADNILGVLGNDTLKGSEGNDTLDGGNDDDQLFGDSDDDKLIGGNGNDSLNGGADNDTLDGGAGNDTLNGGLDADIMIGGDGDDYYFIDNINDKITESSTPRSGNDSVEISINLIWQNNFSNFVGVENYFLKGQQDINAAGDDNANKIEGNDGNNQLFGNGGNDILIGNDGNDTLNGGKGVDILKGGAGDDTYVINNEEDTIEDDNGTDVIQSSETITISKYTTVEDVELTGDKAINTTGNEKNNTLIGNDNNNKLSGKEGNDTLQGLDGDDTLIGGSGNDSLDGGQGENDVVIYSEPQSNYKQIETDGRYGIIDIKTGETDDLHDVEFIQYSDTGLIPINDTPTLSLSIADVNVKEGDKNGSTKAVLTLSLNSPATEAFSVDVSTLDGTAVVKQDYTAFSETIAFDIGQQTADFRIPIFSDKKFENDENFTIQLSHISSEAIELTNADATVTIQNDDKPSLSFSAVKITEGQKGKSNAEISVTLSDAISQAVKVHYQTVDGSALNFKDYTATTGDLIIPANTKTAKFTIPILDDKVSESTETFTVKFSNPDNATLPSNSSVTVTILDDDPPIALIGTTTVG